LGFLAITAGAWIASTVVWLLVLRRRVTGQRDRVLFAAALGLATTFVGWIVVIAISAGRTND